MRLSPAEIDDIRRRVRRYGAANCWTGTSGTIAADAKRLLNHMEAMGMAGEYPEGGTDDEPIGVDHILRGDAELKAIIDRTKPPADGMRPGSREFVAILDEIRDLHLRKTLDYGADEDALANIRRSADYVNVPAWAGCVIRMADKMHRLRSFFRRGRVEFDGVEDTLLDLAAYAVIALVLYRESRNVTPPHRQ